MKCKKCGCAVAIKNYKPTEKCGKDEIHEVCRCGHIILKKDVMTPKIIKERNAIIKKAAEIELLLDKHTVVVFVWDDGRQLNRDSIKKVYDEMTPIYRHSYGYGDMYNTDSYEDLFSILDEGLLPDKYDIYLPLTNI